MLRSPSSSVASVRPSSLHVSGFEVLFIRQADLAFQLVKPFLEGLEAFSTFHASLKMHGFGNEAIHLESNHLPSQELPKREKLSLDLQDNLVPIFQT